MSLCVLSEVSGDRYVGFASSARWMHGMAFTAC